MYSTMKYTLQTLSPVLVTGEQGDANILRTLDYIPGSVILGAFASRYIKKNGPVMEKTGGEVEYDDNFYSWFLSGDLKFIHAYPVVHDDNVAVALEPTPLSIQIDKKGEVRRNMLLNSDVGGDPDPGTRPLGEYIGSKSKGDKTYFLDSPEKAIFFHHARSGRLEGSSQEGEIFNYEALCEGQCFSGFIAGSQEKTKAFKDYFGDKILLTVGRSRSAQYGRVLLKLEESQEPDYDNILDSYFNHDNYDDDDNASLIIFLRTPLIMENEYGFSGTSLSDLESHINDFFGENNIEITGSFYKIQAVENYIAVWGMKRPLDLGFTGGSAFRLEFDRPMDEALKKKIIALLEQGLGKRRNEGFGSISILPTLALEFGKDLREKSLKKATPQKPEGELPEILKTTYTQMIRDILQKIAEQRGRGDAAGYIKTPSNSLLGRLELMINGIDPVGEVDFMKQFASIVERLRDKAKKSLKNCYQRSNDGDLLKDIESKNAGKTADIFFTAKTSYEKLEELAKLCGYNFEEDTALGNDLHRAYWLSLLRRMRIINKEKDR